MSHFYNKKRIIIYKYNINVSKGEKICNYKGKMFKRVIELWKKDLFMSFIKFLSFENRLIYAIIF